MWWLGCLCFLLIFPGYRAPFDIYFQLHRDPGVQHAVQSGRNYTICYGKEWHRFPASFFVPSLGWDVRFVESDFKGQLPDRYSPHDSEGTRRKPEHMNDLNLEEPSRYVSQQGHRSKELFNRICWTEYCNTVTNDKYWNYLWWVSRSTSVNVIILWTCRILKG